MKPTPPASPACRVLHVIGSAAPAPELLADGGALFLNERDALDLPATRVLHAGRRAGFGPRRAGAVAAAIRDFEPDIVHTHDGALAHALFPALWYRVPAIVHTIRDGRAPTLPSLAVRRWVLSRHVHPVAVSTAAARTFAEASRVEVRTVIPDGIAVDRCVAAAGVRQFWRRKEGIPAADFVMLCAEPFQQDAGHEVLLAAFAVVRPRLPDSLLLLLGAGPLENEAKARAIDLGIAHRVKFLGERADITDALAASDAFVCPSAKGARYLPHAMAAARPAAAVRSSDAKDLVRHGEDGYLVGHGDDLGLAEALLMLGEDPRRRAEMGRSARVRARDTASLEASREAYWMLYARLRGGAAPEPAARVRTSRVLEMSWRKGD